MGICAIKKYISLASLLDKAKIPATSVTDQPFNANEFEAILLIIP